MCGRYYIDSDTEREIKQFLSGLHGQPIQEYSQDIFPSQTATVLRREADYLTDQKMIWGFPGFEGKNLIINARAETVLEKKTFRESVLQRRCVIAAKGFYEWNKQKEKFKFLRMDNSCLFMAGCFRQFHKEHRFVILTTQANESVSSVHDRMPLILEHKEVEQWILDDTSVPFFLSKTPVSLQKKTSYEQMRLF